MRGEIHVTLLIHQWERARQIATGWYKPHQDIRSALNEAASDQLGTTFPELADVLTAELGPQGPGPFTEWHLKELTHPRVKKTLADVIGCAVNDALDTLLDPQLSRRC